VYCVFKMPRLLLQKVNFKIVNCLLFFKKMLNKTVNYFVQCFLFSTPKIFKKNLCSFSNYIQTPCFLPLFKVFALGHGQACANFVYVTIPFTLHDLVNGFGQETVHTVGRLAQCT